MVKKTKRTDYFYSKSKGDPKEKNEIKTISKKKIYSKVPTGYTKVEGATTNPKGAELYSNNKSRFNGERESVLVKTVSTPYIEKSEFAEGTFINPNKNKIWNMPTKNQLNKIPEIYAQDGKGENAKVYMKLFTPNMTFYVTEYDKKTGDMFGYVKNEAYGEGELEYFNYNELKNGIAQSGGMNYLDRDLHFTPKTIKEIKN